MLAGHRSLIWTPNPASKRKQKGTYLVVILLIGLGRLQGLGLPSCNRTPPPNQPSEDPRVAKPNWQRTNIRTPRPQEEGGETEQRNAPCFDMADRLGTKPWWSNAAATRRGERLQRDCGRRRPGARDDGVYIDGRWRARTARPCESSCCGPGTQASCGRGKC
jgi:hypothetical protein